MKARRVDGLNETNFPSGKSFTDSVEKVEPEEGVAKNKVKKTAGMRDRGTVTVFKNIIVCTGKEGRG